MSRETMLVSMDVIRNKIIEIKTLYIQYAQKHTLYGMPMLFLDWKSLFFRPLFIPMFCQSTMNKYHFYK